MDHDKPNGSNATPGRAGEDRPAQGGAPKKTTQALDAEAVAEFLRTAPADVVARIRDEASSVAEAGSAAASGIASPAKNGEKPAGGPTVAVTEADDPAEAEMAGLDDDELDDDDLFHQRAKARRAAKEAAVTAAMADGGNGTQPERVSSPLWPIALIVVAIVGGACFGMWFMGRPDATAASQSADTMPQVSTGLSEAETAAKIKELTATVKQDPADVDARLELGVLLFNSKDMDGALEQYQAVLKADPENIKAWYNMGFYHLSSDPADMDAARAAWDKVIEIDPDSDEAQTVQTHIGGLMTGDGSSSSPSSTSTPSAPSEDG